MESKVKLENVYVPSEDVVARDIQGELFIIPVTAGLEGEEDAIFSLNKTGRAVWDSLDGKKCLKDVVGELMKEFGVSEDEITRDVFGLVDELLKRKMLVGIVE